MLVDLPPRIEFHLEYILDASQKFDVRPSLIAAIIHQESGGRPEVIEYTAFYRYLLTPQYFARSLKISYQDELRGQKTSYGLMQIKCSTARSIGFMKVCKELFNPYTNIFFGTKYFSILRNRYKSDAKAISAYNQGQPFRLPNGSFVNHRYVSSVQALDRKFLWRKK